MCDRDLRKYRDDADSIRRFLNRVEEALHDARHGRFDGIPNIAEGDIARHRRAAERIVQYFDRLEDE
jgi:hypothetical protein